MPVSVMVFNVQMEYYSQIKKEKKYFSKRNEKLLPKGGRENKF